MTKHYRHGQDGGTLKKFFTPKTYKKKVRTTSAKNQPTSQGFASLSGEKGTVPYPTPMCNYSVSPARCKMPAIFFVKFTKLQLFYKINIFGSSRDMVEIFKK
jgi:hypothetical protein